MGAGRPTKYKPEFCHQAREIAKLGAIDAEIATILGVANSTLDLWKNEYPEFSEALNEGKEIADSNVQKSLYHRAVGYSHKAVKIFQTRDGETIEHEYTERYPPDPTSGIFWLKNRKRADWKDRHDVDHTTGGQPFNVSIAPYESKK